MKKNHRNIILFIAVLVFLIGTTIAYNMYTKGPVNVSEGDAIEVTPASLYKAYVNDSAIAHKTYDGKIVQLTGEVSNLTTNTDKEQVILIKTLTEAGYINCTMEEPTSGISPGSIITVKGICTGIGHGDQDLGIAADVYLTRAIRVK